MGGVKVEKYILNQPPLGKGATSLVFSGQSEHNGRVVIKKHESLRGANQEAGILQSLPVHKHIITWLDFFVKEKKGYLVLEYHPGKRLGHFKKGIVQNEKIAVQITINILEALNVIHQHGILHCDITPHNVLICDDDPKTVKIIDFGSAVRTNESGEYIGNHRGATRWYRPPELKKENNVFIAHLNYSSDLYSAACVCLYLLTGQAPFRKKKACEQISNKDLQKVLRRATRKNKSKRFQHAQDLINALLPFSESTNSE
jgi:serine/threonine protein kinase